MSHLLNRVFSFLFARASVSSIQKKTLIVNFKKAVDNNIRFINLKNFSEISFKIEKVESTHPHFGNNYNLIMSTKTDLSSPQVDTSLGHFETKENADKALLDLNNKMYGKSLTVTSFLITVMVVFLISLMILDYATIQATKLVRSVSNSSQVSPTNSPQLEMQSQTQIQEQMKKFIEAQKRNQANAGSAPSQGAAPSNNAANDPVAPNFPSGTDEAQNIVNVLK